MTRSLIPALALAALALPATAEAGKPTSGFTFPADFDIVMCWGTTVFDPDCQWTENVLYADGTIEQTWMHIPIPGGDLEYSLFGTWELRKGGKELEIVWPGEYLVTTYVGTRASDGCYEGTMSHTGGDSGVWEGCRP